MNDLHERERLILDALVRQYVKTANPVSSKDLRTVHQLPFSSATIRNDFLTLDKKGYLAKPHISAGRIPTEKAYRFYITGHEILGEMQKKEKLSLRRLHHDGQEEEFLQDVSVLLSELTKSFVLAGMMAEKIFFKHGFSEILQEPEFLDVDIAKDFGKLIDEFDQEAEEWFSRLPNRKAEVFIGKENPVKDAEHFGMIVYNYTPVRHGTSRPISRSTAKIPSIARDRKNIITLLGPKRMDYERGLSVLKEFDEMIENLYE